MKPDDIKILVCPVCHHHLYLQQDCVICEGCSRRYPIVDGIPILLAHRTL
jgi:uncharacterized protein YbaR (Trm112 family)